MDFIIIAVGVVAIVVCAIVWSSKRGERPNSVPSQEVLRPSAPPAPVPVKHAPSRLSAADMLLRVQALRKADAQWDAIWSELNPTGDPELQRLLVQIRGPHMFVPHLGLSVIEDGCKRVLSVSPKVDALTALREAIRSQEPFV